MTNSDSKRKAATLITEVFELTDEEYLRHRIDEPIEKAAANFEFDKAAPVTHRSFTQVTSGFVRQVYERGPWTGQVLSDSEARAEAIAILAEGYQGANGRGYYTGFLDAWNPELDGLEFVLAQIAKLITVRARAKHVRWVCATRIEFLDWPTRCLITEILLRRWEPFLSLNILRCSPAQFAHHLPELITAMLSTNTMVGKILGANTDLLAF